MSGDLAQYRGDAYSADEQVEVIAWAYSHEHANAMAAAVVEEWSPQVSRIVMRPAPVAESTRFAAAVRPLRPAIYLEIPIPWEVRMQVDTMPNPGQPRGELGP
jgi:hypothetical protein